MISIIDYGVGNINAFANILFRKNIQFRISKTAKDLTNISKIILPGVGSFDAAMNALNNSGMRENLDELVVKNKIQVLGVCVGMQIMFNRSEEGSGKGLGWIDCEVIKINDKNEYPLPHMGWNTLQILSQDNIFQGINNSPEYYFLHSFYVPKNEYTLATAFYSDEISAVINKNNIYGMQCHPEKSHDNGEKFLLNFCTM